MKQPEQTKRTTAAQPGAKPPKLPDFEVLLAALPHPILVIGDDDKVCYANGAAEVFLTSSLAMLTRETVDNVFAFGCPLIGLIEQVRRTGATVNEYAVEMVTQKFVAAKLVDVYAGPLPQHPGSVVLMLQQRTMAQMIERQLTHRAAARTVSGMAAVLAHEIKNPLSGIRGAAQLLEPDLSDEDRALTQLICSETDRIKNLVDIWKCLAMSAHWPPSRLTSMTCSIMCDGYQKQVLRGACDLSKTTIPRCHRFRPIAISWCRPFSTS